MKVTAIIPNEIINEVHKYAKGKNVSDSLIIALNEWLYTRRIEQLNDSLSKKPLQFQDGYSAEQIRKLNN